MDIELTKAEELAIELLKKVERHWPDTLWLFAAEKALVLMKYLVAIRIVNVTETADTGQPVFTVGSIPRW